MAKYPPSLTHSQLMIHAQFALHLTQKRLGELLGTSHRTAQRWQHGSSSPSSNQLAKLAVALHPVDVELATHAATLAGTTLEALIPKPPPPAPPPVVQPAIAPRAMPFVARGLLVAIAEALDVDRSVVRSSLLEAHAQSATAGLTLEELANALRALDEPPRQGAKASGGGSGRSAAS